MLSFDKQLTKNIQFDYVNVDFIAYNQLDIINRTGLAVMGWGATFGSSLLIF
jgi:hypothetical protein